MDKHFDALDAFGHAASLLGDGEQNKREGIVTHLCESYANHVNTGRQKYLFISISAPIILAYACSKETEL